jgi:hypothetical protein
MNSSIMTAVLKKEKRQSLKTDFGKFKIFNI